MLTEQQQRVLMLVSLVTHLPWVKTAAGKVRWTPGGFRVCPLCALERELDSKCESNLSPEVERTGIPRAAMRDFMEVADYRINGGYLPARLNQYRAALLELLGLEPDA